MKKIFALLIVCGLFTFLLSGCAAWQSSVDDPMTELVVRATTARVLAEHPGWTSSTVTITGNALMMIDGDPLTSLEALQESIIAQIDWNSLMPEEQALLQILISRVRVRLEERLGESGVGNPGQYLLPVKQILLWINQTAALRVTSNSHECPDLFAGVDLDKIIEQAAAETDRVLGLTL